VVRAERSRGAEQNAVEGLLVVQDNAGDSFRQEFAAVCEQEASDAICLGFFSPRQPTPEAGLIVPSV
jgi:hypothetical protein